MEWAEQVRKATRKRIDANRPIWNLIKEVKKSSELSKNEKENFLAELYGSLSDKDVPAGLVSEAQNFNVGTSFRSSITDLIRTKRRMRQLGVNILHGNNPKLKDREFARALGVPVPKTYACEVELSEIPLVAQSIVKPVRGSSSKAVFYVDEALQLHSVRSSKKYWSFDEAASEISGYKSSISKDSWLAEEAILDSSGKPANDLKIYAFYGKAGMFLEIDRNSAPQPLNATFDDTGHPIRLGPTYKTFQGTNLPTEAWEMAEVLSLAAPVPFMRLDFHHGANGLRLGEITPHPGGTYAGQLFDSVDKMLGRHYADAKTRLIIDLLNSKEFSEFKSIYDVSYGDRFFESHEHAK